MAEGLKLGRLSYYQTGNFTPAATAAVTCGSVAVLVSLSSIVIS